jgi:hypothetical protein
MPQNSDMARRHSPMPSRRRNRHPGISITVNIAKRAQPERWVSNWVGYTLTIAAPIPRRCRRGKQNLRETNILKRCGISTFGQAKGKLRHKTQIFWKNLLFTSLPTVLSHFNICVKLPFGICRPKKECIANSFVRYCSNKHTWAFLIPHACIPGETPMRRATIHGGDPWPGAACLWSAGQGVLRLTDDAIVCRGTPGTRWSCCNQCRSTFGSFVLQ